MNEQQQYQPSQEDLQRMYKQVTEAINMYYSYPDSFSSDQLKRLKGAADSLGIGFSPNFSTGRAVKKGLYELGEGLTLGLLPNSWDPGALNDAEALAGSVGGLLGLATPVGVAAKAGGGALRIAKNLASGRGLGFMTSEAAAASRAGAYARGLREVGHQATQGARLALKAEGKRAAPKAIAERAKLLAQEPSAKLRALLENSTLPLEQTNAIAKAINKIKNKKVRGKMADIALKAAKASRQPTGAIRSGAQMMVNHPNLTRLGVGYPVFAGVNRFFDGGGEEDPMTAY